MCGTPRTTTTTKRTSLVEELSRLHDGPVVSSLGWRGAATWCITYTDDGDEGCPDFTWHCRALDAAQAEEKFLSDEDGGWKILSIRRVKPRADAQR